MKDNWGLSLVSPYSNSIFHRLRGGIVDFGRRHFTEEISTGYGIWLIGMIPTFLFAAGIQILTNPTSIITNSIPSSHGSSANFINYISISITHNIICWSIIINSLVKCHESLSRRRQLRLRFHALLSCLLLFAFVVSVVSYLDLDIELLSHDLVYTHAEATPGIAALMQDTLLEGTPYAFHPFSILPMLSVLVAYWAVICMAYELAAVIIGFTSRADETTKNWEYHIESFRQDVKWIFIRILVILITSSAATAIYFATGIGTSSNPEIPGYEHIAQAMSSYWGIVFSLMMVSLFILPFRVYKRKLGGLRRVFAGYSDEEKEQYELKIQPYALLSINFQYALGFMMPFLTSFIGPLFS